MNEWGMSSIMSLSISINPKKTFLWLNNTSDWSVFVLLTTSLSLAPYTAVPDRCSRAGALDRTWPSMSWIFIDLPSWRSSRVSGCKFALETRRVWERTVRAECVGFYGPWTHLTILLAKFMAKSVNQWPESTRNSIDSNGMLPLVYSIDVLSQNILF